MEPKTPVPFRDKRPWGEELWFMKSTKPDELSTTPSMVKILSIKPNEMLSLQYHNNRDEFWHVISGNGRATIDDKLIKLERDSECFVPRNVKHRLAGGTEPLVILELAYGTFDEKDIVRLEDRYGRKQI